MNSTLKRFFASLIILTIIITGCGTIKNATQSTEDTKNEYSDSLSIKNEVRDSIIYVPIPLEAGQAIVNVGDTSKLETSVAKSLAYIDRNGKLWHSLDNKSDRRLQAIVPVKTKEIFHGVTSNRAQTLKITNTVYKEKELTHWQKCRLRGFWWLLVIDAVLLCYIFRKPLLKLAKRWTSSL